MRTLLGWTSRLAWVAIALATLAGAGSAQIKINEIRTDQTGTDTDEYFELMGTPGTSLTGLTYIVVGDSGGIATCGVIEAVIPLSAYSIQADGFFAAVDGDPGPTLTGYDVVIGSPGSNSLNFENSDNVTHMLVSGFTGTSNQDLDTNDDGVFDVTPWTAIIDAVGLDEGTIPNCTSVGTIGSDDLLYSTTVVGPDGTFVPGHVYRCSDSGLWKVGAFSPLGSTDTPGQGNLSCLGPLPDVIDEARDPCVPGVGQAVTVTVIVSHTAGANLHYKVNGGAETVLPMTFAGLSGTDSVYQGLIPGRPTNADRVEYRVKAFNANPDTVSGFNQGYFVGTTNVSTLRANDGSGQTLYPFYGARVRGTVTVADGIFSSINTDYYVQDATGGINISKGGRHQTQPGLGDDVTVSGVLEQFRGKLQITEGGPCDSVFVTINDVGAPPDPLDINPCDMSEAQEGMLVRMVRARLTTTDNQFPPGVDTNFELQGCDSIAATLRIDMDTDVDGQPITSPAMDVVGILSQFDQIPPFDAGYQVMPRAYSDITFLDPRTAVDDRGGSAGLFFSRPNPFTRSAEVRYRVPGAASGQPVRVKLRVLDIQGRELATLVDGFQVPGDHTVMLDGASLGRARSTILFCRLEMGDLVFTRKAIFLR